MAVPRKPPRSWDIDDLRRLAHTLIVISQNLLRAACKLNALEDCEFLREGTLFV